MGSSRHERAVAGLAMVARVTALCVLVALPFLLAPSSLVAQDRLVRRFGGESGLTPSVVALAQDSVGFLWAGTRGGLFRYDGARFERWARDVLPRAVGSIAVSPAGVVVVVDADGRIFELTGDAARPVPGAARRSPDHVHVAAFDAAGRLWVVTLDGEVAWREDDGRWRTLPPGALQGDAVRRLFPGGPSGGVLAAGEEGLWRLRPGMRPERVLDTFRLADVRAQGDQIVALSVSGEVIRFDDAAPPEILTAGADIPVTRGISLAEREGAIWAATDRYLIAVEPDGSVQVLGPKDGVVAGGPLLVDHEGSLWHAGFTTLSQYPEPRTQVWDESHGLPSAHTRFLARSRDALWVTTWQGAGYLNLTDGGWRAGIHPAVQARARPCSDGEGGLWLATYQGLQHLRGLEAKLVEPGANLGTCTPAVDGGFWWTAMDGLRHLPAGRTSTVPIPSFPYAGDPVQVVLEDREGRVWVGSQERICRASAREVIAGEPTEWSCRQLPPGLVHLNALVELPSGTLWAASTTLGVLRHDDGQWEVLAANETTPTRSVLDLVPSPRGGFWLVGTGIVQRVAARDDGSSWTVLEELGSWHGLPSVGGGHLLEEDDGTVWIATALGVIRVPAEARSVEPLPPRMAVVEARVDGERLPLEGPLVLPPGRNRLELRFAALTFRDPGRVRYQVRLSPDEAWADTEGRPYFHWVDLSPGPHRPQVRASLDAVRWSPQPAGLDFRVLPPWYRTPEAMGIFVLLAAGLLFGLYRARLAYLLGLERQRTRIAMDLHDEMGSGLASIGVLGSVLSSGAGAPPADRRIAREVAATAEELGTALSDIVWSLDPRGATLEELAARLAEHGGRLFADEVRFDTDFPDDWPRGPLPLSVLRNVLLIGLEALHNAARHAGADAVLLSLRPDGDAWTLALTDDGAGLPEGGEAGTGRGDGRGLRGMRRRAQEIGGTIAWETRPGRGTTVRLRFQPAPGRSRWLGWLRRTDRRVRAEGAHEPRAAGSHEHASARTDAAAHR